MSAKKYLFIPFTIFVTTFLMVHCDDDDPGGMMVDDDEIIISKDVDLNPALVEEGKQTFRFDTFGDESFWTDVLHIDKAVLGAENGGFGPGVSPETALAVGLKVDADALSQEIVDAISAGEVDLSDPKTTIALLQEEAVIGLKGSFNDDGSLVSLGVTCAVCHSTVDDSFAAGIGSRLDGWPNRDLDVGAILNLSDNLEPVAELLTVPEQTLRDILAQWGPGRYNAVVFFDGKATTPSGDIATNLIPAAYGMQGLDLVTYTGWGDLSYWNALVATLEMNGHGPLIDPRLNDPVKYPIAAANDFGNTMDPEDLVTSKLEGLRQYQLSLEPPIPPDGSFDEVAAQIGKDLFEGKGQCSSCHFQEILADNVLHSAEEIGIDDFEASRSPTGMYRTTPLRGLFARMKGGFYHDGRYATLDEVLDHYDDHFNLQLSDQEKSNIVEYLKSI